MQRVEGDSSAYAGNAETEENVFMDKRSGKDFERPQYKRLLKRLKEE